jgi:CMP-N-acetylneuraminic acid synthetase
MKLFAGKPMLLWNLRKCRSIFKKVYVSSDSDEILQLAVSAGAIPIKRGEELCGDVPDIPVFQHALSQMDNPYGIVAVHADTPGTRGQTIMRVKEAVESGCREVMTCHPMTHTENYHDSHNRIYGSVRGMTRFRLLNYGDPYKPEPEMLIVDDAIEIETQESFDKALCQFN